MDETDKQILEILEENGRESYREIAEATGVTPPTVKSRIDDMVENGVIEGFTVEVNQQATTEGDLIKALVTVSGESSCSDEIVQNCFETVDGSQLCQIAGTRDEVQEFIEGIEGHTQTRLLK